MDAIALGSRQKQIRFSNLIFDELKDETELKRIEDCQR